MNENKVKVWLARDMNGSLYLSQIKTKKENFGWVIENPEYSNSYVKIDANNFPSVKWEDSEPTEAYITLANEPQEQPKKEIDWEQRKYEIAKDTANSILSCDEQIKFACQEAVWNDEETHTTPKAIAQYAIALADELINELKKKSE